MRVRRECDVTWCATVAGALVLLLSVVKVWDGKSGVQEIVNCTEDADSGLVLERTKSLGCTLCLQDRMYQWQIPRVQVRTLTQPPSRVVKVDPCRDVESKVRANRPS